MEVCGEVYRDISKTARRWARSADEARDLVQDTLMIALNCGFDDWQSPARRAWLRGVVRKRAAFLVRGEQRRRRREQLHDGAGVRRSGRVWHPGFLASLPRSLRVVFHFSSSPRLVVCRTHAPIASL